MHAQNKQRHKQQGIALIVALIVTMLAVTIATTVLYRQQIHIRLSGNIAHLEQAYIYAQGMEGFAGEILEASYKDHPNYDSLKDVWAFEGIVFPILGGTMSGQMYDLQGRINLNSLARPIPPEPKLTDDKGIKLNPAPVQQPDIAGITRYRLLSLMQEIDPDDSMGPPQDFARIVKDWIDKDQINGNTKPDPDPGTGSGAESPFYQSMEPAYFSANTLLVNPTELRLLKNMNKEIYNKLINPDPKKSLVATLPITDANNKPLATPINVNTASKEVLQSIGFDPATAEDIIRERDIDPFEEMKNSFLQSAIQSQGANIDVNDLDVKSSYFLLRGTVEINNARLTINSILYRKNGKVSVIMRDFSNP
ncbi:MAG: type II secretion system minor pseudopilin GspK [Cocleimonas sp.]|nr:type II secretion system minor pseudopilin GspK [Cocleimonas sp.]